MITAGVCESSKMVGNTVLPAPESLLTIWTEFNRRYFQGALPPIPIEWSRRLTSSAGMFVCRIGPRQALQGTDEERLRRRRIRLSALLLQQGGPEPQRETIVTLAHEMIHQWQFDILRRRPNHGPDFRRMMARMNQDGLGITLYHSLGTAVAALAKYAWRCQHCGSIYRRHRRTIQPRRHVCGSCRGPLRELAVDNEASPPASIPAPLPMPSLHRQIDLPFQQDAEKVRQRRSRVTPRLTVPQEYDSPLRLPRPCWAAFLRIL